jgi:hypothetical protein
MKLLITESQYNALMDIDELKSRSKEKFNSGNFHMIYPMENDPTKLIKVGAKSVIDGWYGLFVANPNLFPKVYKRGETPLVSNGRKFIGAYVIIERLNTSDFKRIWAAFETLLGKYHQVTGDKNRLGLQKLFVTIEDHMDIIGKMLEIAKSNQVLYDYFKEFVDLLLQVYEIKPSADIHEDQFGLDAEGKIKCLDL